MSIQTNYLQNKDFSLVLSRIPNVSYFCSSVTIPSITNTNAQYPTPFTMVNVPGDSLNFGALDITFRVDRDLVNYEELLRWMESFGTPDNFGQYKVIAGDSVKQKLSDATIITSTNKYNPNINFVFEDVFPTVLGDLTFDTTQNDVPVTLCNASFTYTKFTLVRT